MAIGVNDFLENVIGFRGPDKWLRIHVMPGCVFLNGGDQFRHIMEDSALQLIDRNIAKKAFGHIEPGCGCRCEMNIKGRIFLQ